MNHQAKIDAYFQQLTQRIYSVHQRLGPLIGNAVVNDSLDNFATQSFDKKPWAKRKRDKEPGRAILVKSGRLRRSPRIIASSPTSVTVGTDVPYARIHNDGGTINHPGRKNAPMAFKTYTRGKHKGKTLFARNNPRATFARKITTGPYDIAMPRRRFLGVSKKLSTDIKKIISEEYNKEFPNTR